MTAPLFLALALEAAVPNLPHYLSAPDRPFAQEPLVITNGGSQPLACRITLAHWYVLDYGPLPPGGQVALPLRLERQSQMVSVLNAKSVEMAVEGLACGSPGRMETTQTRLPFREIVSAGQAALTCRTDGQKTTCAP